MTKEFETQFVGQLWKLTNEMKLINKNGNWMHDNLAWTITAEGSEGNIEEQSSGKVLGLLNDATDIGTPVGLESKKRSVSSDGQKWLRDIADVNGWFRLKNPLSGRVLTAQSSTVIAIAGKNFHVYVFGNTQDFTYRTRAIQNRGYYFFFTIYKSGYYCRAVIN